MWKYWMNRSELENLNLVAARLAELGHPTRLSIFKMLVKSGNDAVSVGDILQEIDIPGSTLSHHISKMVKVGLIKQKRESRNLFCIPQFHALEQVIGFLQDECCVNQK
jgi:ArsR family transcriptional regulator, arsenate/arsenite/antimonite-responsive transcriptional repressor